MCGLEMIFVICSCALKKCIKTSKEDFPINTLGKKYREAVDKVYSLCKDFIKLYEDQTKWEKLFNKKQNNG